MPRMGRSKLVEIAYKTLAAIKDKQYTAPSGATVVIDAAECVNSTKFYIPDETERLALAALSLPKVDTKIELLNETSLQGAKRLTDAYPTDHVGVLNFASARNPGGGFLDGAFSQEESLARSSALYPSLLTVPQYYNLHRTSKSSGFYSDAMIVTSHCPTFVDDEGTFLEQPYKVTYITCAAPNAGVIGLSERDRLPLAFLKRTTKVMAVALHHGIETLILGAWGCGIFRNDPIVVSDVFHTLLTGPFENKFKRIVFSCFDPSPRLEIFNAFKDRFGS